MHGTDRVDGTSGTGVTYGSAADRRDAGGGKEPVRVAVTELRDGLAEWLNRVAWGGETLLVHRRGRPLALVTPCRGAGAIPAPSGEEAPSSGKGSPSPPPITGGAGGEDAPLAGDERARDRDDLRAIFRAIAASAGEVPRAWRPVRPGGPRVRMLSAAARELRALEGEHRAAAERLLDLLAAGALTDVPPLPGTAGRVFRLEAEEGRGPRLLWRREDDGSMTVLLVQAPGQGQGT